MLLHFHLLVLSVIVSVGPQLPSGLLETVTYHVANHLCRPINPTLLSRTMFGRASATDTVIGGGRRRRYKNTVSAICSRFKQFILKIDPAGGINQSQWQQRLRPIRGKKSLLGGEVLVFPSDTGCRKGTRGLPLIYCVR